MGKPGGGRKKQNAGVGVDFKRVKHRVGKKLPRAQNQTDTSFKSRTISLAEQSVATDKEGLAVTTRNLTLKDLLGQCGHYSERVRRDALQGLAELLAAHPEELRRHATLVVEAAAARVGDGDPTVRTTARELLATRLLPALGGVAVAPYVPLLMAHVCAAMTHLAEPIRADALGFLELLVEVRPDLVAAGFLPPVLLHFSDLLSRGTRGRSIKAGSLASLATVAASLSRFLARTLPAATALGPGASLSSLAEGVDGVVCGGLSDGMGGGQQAGVLFWQRCAWPPLDQSSTSSHPSAAVAAEGSGGGGGGSSNAVGGKSGETADAGCSAAASLLGRLLECWSEAGPSQLALTGDLMAAQCLTAILSCCDLLLGTWGASLAGSVHDRTSLASRLLTSVTPHFPVLRPATPIAPALADQLVALNVAAAQLLARFLPAQAAAGRGAGTADVAGRPAGTAAGQAKVKEEAWVGRLLEWFAGVMAEGAALPAADSNRLFEEAPAELEAEAIAAGTGAEGAGGGSGSKRRRGSSSKTGGSGNAPREAGLPKEVYQSALDSSLRMLPLLPPPRRRQLLTAAAALWQRSTPRGTARPRVLAFWAALLRDPASAFYAATPGGGPLLQQADPASWLPALPRYLFELGSSNSSASHSALCLLMAAARAAPAGGQLATALQELQPQMAPLFAVLLPSVNGGGSGSSRHAASKKQQQGQQQTKHVEKEEDKEQEMEQQEEQEGPRVHVGPLASLPVATQELAVDLLYHFPAASEQMLRAAAVVCLAGSYPVATAQRLLEVLASKAAAGAADPAAFCGLLLNVLSGSSAAGLRQCSWERHMAIVKTACDAALRLGRPADVAAALLPALLDAACGEKTGNAGGSGNGINSSRAYAAYGLLRMSASLSSAAAAALEELELPSAVVEAVPRLMLQLVDAGQQQERTAAVSQQQHEQQARQQQERQQQGSSGSDALSCQAATALSLRLICLLPQQLVPALLSELSGILAGAQRGAEQHIAAQNVLPAALRLLEALVGEMQLREALLEQQEGVQVALAACRAACEAAGSMTHGGRDCLQSLRQLEALCGAVLAV